MDTGDGIVSFEIRDRAGQLEEALPGPPGEAQVPHGAIQQCTGSGVQRATPLDLSIAQARVAAALSRELARAGGGDAEGECRARFPSADATVEVAHVQPGDLHVHVETVE